MGRSATLAFAALFFAALSCGGRAAELPSQARKATTHESAQALKKCNIGGIAGILAANGVCVKLSGSISARFGGSPIR